MLLLIFVCWKSRSAQKYCVCSLRSCTAAVVRSREEEMKNLLRLSNFIFYISTFIFLQQRKHTSFTRESSWSLFIGFFSSVCMCERCCRMQFINRELSSCGRAVRMNESGGKSAFLLPPLADLLLLFFFRFVEWSSTTRARIATAAARLSSCLTQIKTLHKLQFFVLFFRCLRCCSKSTKPPPSSSSPLNFLFHFILFIHMIAPPSYTTCLYTLGRLWLRLRWRRRKESWRKKNI